MSLAEDLKEFFVRYERREKKIEQYGEEFLPLINRVPDDEGVERRGRDDLINNVLPSLSVHVETIIELRAKGKEQTSEDKQDLKERIEKIAYIIIKFRYSDVYKRYYETISVPEESKSTSRASQRDEIEKNRSIPSKDVQTIEDDPMLVAIEIVKRRKPDAPPAEILRAAAQYVSKLEVEVINDRINDPANPGEEERRH